MDVSSPELLSQLELVMTEFFTGNTSNERKQEIECQLNAVWQQPDAWKHCLYCISNTNNEFVAMASITALENLVNHQHSGSLSYAQLLEIRQTIFLTVCEKHSTMQNYVRNKLVKVVVDVARIQWPHEYPNFIDDIMRVGQPVDGTSTSSSPGVVLCLVFLQVAAEELAIREHQLMPHVRKLEIKQHLHSHAPLMLCYITGVLENLLLCPSEVGSSAVTSGGTTTPPPSPSHSPHSPDSPQQGLSASGVEESHLHSVLRVLEQRSQSHYQPPPRWLQHAASSTPAWDANADNQAYVALNCLTQMLAWVPLPLLAAGNDTKLIDIIFTFAALGGVQTVSSVSSNTVSISAVSCVQELLSRPCVPHSLNPLLLHVLHSCCALVHYLLDAGSGTGPVASSAKQRLATLHPTYLDKVTELVRVLVTIYFRRFEHHPQFNVEEFLALLFRYSFSQPSLDGYLDCLDVWSTLLELLCGRGGETGEQYHPVLEVLAQGVLHKIQLRHNQSELEELDYDLLEEASQADAPDAAYSEAWAEQPGSGAWSEGGTGAEHLTEQSECQSFFSHNLDLLARLAEIMPDKIMDLVVPAWQQNCSVYLSLETSLRLERVAEPGGLGTTLRLSGSVSEEAWVSLHCALRDLCSLLQLLGRLATTCLGAQLTGRADHAMAAIQRLVELGEFGMRLQLYSLDTTIDLLRADLIQIHCEVLCSLRAWSHWLSQLYGHQLANSEVTTSASTPSPSTPSPSAPTPGSCLALATDEGTASTPDSAQPPHLNACHRLTRNLLVLAATSVNDNASGGAPWVVVRCGVQLLLTASVLVVSPVALQVQQVQLLYSAPIYSHSTPPGRVREMLYRALINFLLLPWPSHSAYQLQQQQHTAEDRHRMLTTFMATLTQPITGQQVHHLQADPAIREKASSGIKECLCLIRSQLCQLSGADRASRELYWSCVRQPLYRVFVHLMPLYCNSPGMLLEMVGTVMYSIGVVGGGGSSSSNCVSVDEVCGWIERIVALVSDRQYLALALQNDSSPQAAVLARFLQLLSLVLSDPSPVLKRLVGVVVRTLDNLFPLVAQQPAAAALRQPLFAVLRTLLEHNWKYFYRSSIQQPLSQSPWEEVQNGAQLSRILQAFGQSFMQTDIAVFRQNLATLHLLNNKFRLYSKSVFRPLLSQFITVLLQVLLHGSHALLQDEIIACVYHMASVEMAAFHSQFLDAFLRNMHGLTDHQRHTLRQDFSTDTDFPTFSQSIQHMTNDLRYYRSVNGAHEA